MKVPAISIRRLKIHEFRQTLKYIRGTGATWHDIYLKLGELQSEAIQRFVKQFSAVLAIYLILSALGDETSVSITIQDVTASVPTAYVTATASLALLIAVQSLQSLAMIIDLRTREATSLRLPRFSSNSYGLYHGQDEMALVTPVIVSDFLRDKFGVAEFVTKSILLSYCLFVFPIVGFWWYFFGFQLSILVEGETAFFERIVSMFGVLTNLVTFTFIVLFNVPIPMRKSRFGIRWGFLSRLYPIGGHPRIESWLHDKIGLND